MVDSGPAMGAPSKDSRAGKGLHVATTAKDDDPNPSDERRSTKPPSIVGSLSNRASSPTSSMGSSQLVSEGVRVRGREAAMRVGAATVVRGAWLEAVAVATPSAAAPAGSAIPNGGQQADSDSGTAVEDSSKEYVEPPPEATPATGLWPCRITVGPLQLPRTSAPQQPFELSASLIAS